MRYLLVMIIIISISGCDQFSKKSPPAAYLGEFVRHSQHEFGNEHDTIFIKVIKEQEVFIERRWWYQRNLDGRPLDPTYSVRQTAGLYDPSTNVITDKVSGQLINVSDNGKKLLIGTTIYEKVKN